MRDTRLAALNLLHRGHSLATQVIAFDANSLGWVGVYPLDTSRRTTLEFLRANHQPIPLDGVRAYRVRRFEVSRDLVESDTWISEANLLHTADEIAYGEDALDKVLQRYGTQIEKLELPGNSDYPI